MFYRALFKNGWPKLTQAPTQSTPAQPLALGTQSLGTQSPNPELGTQSLSLSDCCTLLPPASPAPRPLRWPAASRH